MPNIYAATNQKKFLDAEGLAYFSRKLNNYPTNDVIEAVIDGIQDCLDEKVDKDSLGAAGGVATLGEDGKVPSSQLPVDSNITYTLSQDTNNGHIITFTPSTGAATTITIPDDNTWTPLTTTTPGYVGTALPNDDSKYLSGKGTWTVPSYPVTSVAGKTGAVTLAKGDVGLGNVNNTSDADKPISTAMQTALDGKLNTSLKGAANGLAELDSSGKVLSTQLPSYVDDVLEFSERDNFPLTGETGKIYIDLESNKTYRWGGSGYVEISESLALGTTSSTAFRGDYGNAAYTHAVTNKGSAFASGLYKITTNAEGHVTAATAAVKADITALGIPSSDTTYQSLSAVDGGTDVSLVTTGEKNAWNNKIDISQGVSNAGKFLVVNSLGNVEAVAMTAWEGGTF